MLQAGEGLRAKEGRTHLSQVVVDAVQLILGEQLTQLACQDLVRVGRGFLVRRTTWV